MLPILIYRIFIVYLTMIYVAMLVKYESAKGWHCCEVTLYRTSPNRCPIIFIFQKCFVTSLPLAFHSDKHLLQSRCSSDSQHFAAQSPPSVTSSRQPHCVRIKIYLRFENFTTMAMNITIFLGVTLCSLVIKK